MTRRVILTETAKEDLADVWEFYAQDSPSAADRMIDTLLERLRELEAMPELGRRRDELRPGLRSLLVGRYLAFYTLDRRAVTVIRVLHGSRDVERAFGAGEA